MNNKYYYIDGEGQLHRFTVEVDDMTGNPREDDGIIGTMVCGHRDYQFGAESKDFNGNVEKYLVDLVRENAKDGEVVAYIKSHKTERNFKINFNEEEGLYILVGDFYNWSTRKTERCGYAMDETENWLEDDIIDNLTVGEMLAFLAEKDYIFLPLAIYDHSGVTMWCGSKWSHADAQWDCSNVGFIYTTKQKVLETCGGYYDEKENFIKTTSENWKDVALHDMRTEIKVYDMYLKGEVYGYTNEIYEDGDFIECDSCWGYFSDKWGESLTKEIARDSVGNVNFISAEEAEEAMREADIMEQANTLVCI